MAMRPMRKFRRTFLSIMQKFRTVFIALGLLFIFAAGVSFWRSAHPPQSDEELLMSSLDNAASAVRDRSVGRVMSFLAPGFSANGTSRGEFNRMMTGAFFQWRDVQLDLSNQKVQISGDSATTSGHFVLNYRPQEGAAPENHRSDFSLQWRKIDGAWKIVSASGTGGAFKGMGE